MRKIAARACFSPLAALAAIVSLLASSPAVAAPPTSPASPPRTVRVRAVGDLAMSWIMGNAIAREGFDPFADLAGALADADVTFANFETVTSEAPVPEGFVYRQGAPLIRGPLACAALAARAGVDIVALANNHVFDLGFPGFEDTSRLLRQAGLAVIGVGRTAEEAAAPHVMTVNGLRIGWLSFGYGTNHNAGRKAVAAKIRKEAVVAAVTALRPSVDVLLLSLHWGTQYVEEPRRDQVELAHAAIDAGADAIIGHHPHVLQSIEVYRGRPIVYSLGNFVFGTQPLPKSLSAILELEVSAAEPRIVRATILPVVLRGKKGSPMLSPGREGAPVRERLRKVSRRFGTAFGERDGALDVVLR